VGFLALNAVLAILMAGMLVNWAAAASAPPAQPRIEARSASFLAVGLVHGDRMSVHLSRLIDNAPVRDAALTVVLRGTSYPTTAEADGGYTFQTKELNLPGSASVEFQVTEGTARETLKGVLQNPDAAEMPKGKNSARQLWWWVLNFAVCIGFLWLISRRRKAARD
jgi:hypothetical protein